MPTPGRHEPETRAGLKPPFGQGAGDHYGLLSEIVEPKQDFEIVFDGKYSRCNPLLLNQLNAI